MDDEKVPQILGDRNGTGPCQKSPESFTGPGRCRVCVPTTPWFSPFVRFSQGEGSTARNLSSARTS